MFEIIIGINLENILLCYFFIDWVVLVVMGDYVIIDVGIGVVYIVSDYGLDDFNVGLKYGINILNYVVVDGSYVEFMSLVVG